MQSPKRLSAPNTAVFPPSECRRRIEDDGARQNAYGPPSPRHPQIERRVITSCRDGEYMPRDREYRYQESFPSTTTLGRDGHEFDRRLPYEERYHPNDDISEPYYELDAEPYYELDEPQLRYDPRYVEQCYDPAVGSPPNHAPYSPQSQDELRQPLEYSPSPQPEYDGQLESRSPLNYMSPNWTSSELETRVSTSNNRPANQRSVRRQSRGREPKVSVVKPPSRTCELRNAMYRALSQEYSEISTSTADGSAIDYIVPVPRPQSKRAGNSPITDQQRPIRHRVPGDALPRKRYVAERYSGRGADSPRNQPATKQAVETAESTRRIVSAPAAMIVHSLRQAIVKPSDTKQPGTGRNPVTGTPGVGMMVRNGVPHVVTKYGTLPGVVQPPIRPRQPVSVQNNQGCLDTAVKRNNCVGSPRSAASRSSTSTTASPTSQDYLQDTRSDTMRDNTSSTHANVSAGGQQSNREQITAGERGINAHNTSELPNPPATTSCGDQTYKKAGDSHRRANRRRKSKTRHREDPAGTKMTPFGSVWRTVATIGLIVIGVIIYTGVSDYINAGLK